MMSSLAADRDNVYEINETNGRSECEIFRVKTLFHPEERVTVRLIASHESFIPSRRSIVGGGGGGGKWRVGARKGGSVG